MANPCRGKTNNATRDRDFAECQIADTNVNYVWKMTLRQTGAESFQIEIDRPNRLGSFEINQGCHYKYFFNLKGHTCFISSLLSKIHDRSKNLIFGVKSNF